MQFIKRIIEGTSLATMYRAVRNEWRFKHLRFADTPWGYQFAGRPDMQAGTFEQDEVVFIQQHLASADMFVDVGAHIGYFTCLACSMGKYVVAFEPLPDNLRYLYVNLQANGWTDCVEIYPFGVADKPRLTSLYGGGTGASLISGWAGVSPHFKQTIPLSTLDIILGDRFVGKHMVIKMDVEGAEYVAILGAVNTLQAKPRPTLLVEITLSEHRQGAHNPYFLSIFELFWNLGYQAKTVGMHSRKISRSEIEDYANTGIQPDWVTGNYLFCSESN